MKSDNKSSPIEVLTALLLGCAFAALTFAIPNLSVLSSHPLVAMLQDLTENLLWPGLICAFAASGNVHAWHLWIAAIGNFFFYSGITWMICAIWLYEQRNSKDSASLQPAIRKR